MACTLFHGYAPPPHVRPIVSGVIAAVIRAVPTMSKSSQRSVLGGEDQRQKQISKDEVLTRNA